MNHIAHLGGVFIYSEKPAELAEWYKTHFGIQYEYTDEFKAYYASFYYNEIGGDKKQYVAWSILSSKDRPMVPQKLYCINYRVIGMEVFVEKLRGSSIEVKGIEEYPEGKFAWLNDPEGNYIELWQDVE